MTSVVLIRAEAPMQSWGHTPRGAYRASHTRPTKSGVIGLVANALGLDYTDDITDLAALQFGVRADRPGKMELDYHTTGSGNFPLLPGDIFIDPSLRRKATKADPREPGFAFTYAARKEIGLDNMGELSGTAAQTNITRDRYLADASFLISLTGDHPVITRIAEALQHPARALFLGRKAYLPAAPLFEHLQSDTDIIDPFAPLRHHPVADRTAGTPLDMWVEVAPGTPGSQIVHDQPIVHSGNRRRGARAELHTPLGRGEAATGSDTAFDFFEDTDR